jgi:predicted TIM-barrel fold metal-dependent hydrolase
MNRKISRRSFHAAALGAVAAGLHTVARAETPAPGAAARFIDIHTHITLPLGPKPQLTAAGLLAWMDQHAIEKAVVLPLVSPEAWFFIVANEHVLEQTKPHRDRLIPFCCFDPRTIYLADYSAKLDMLKQLQEQGAHGFGEHKAGVDVDDPRNVEWFRACGEVGLPVLLHLDNDRNLDVPGLPAFERVLQQLPQTTFIAHAPGWWSSISGDATQEDLGGYPKSPTAPGGAVDRLLAQYPNLYGDLSAGSGSNAIARDEQYGREFMIRRADQLLFGTDYLAPEQEVPQFALFERLKLPPDVEEKIYRNNARRVLAL